MTANEFNALCLKYLIDPAVALEDADVVAALRQKDRAKVEAVLRHNF